MRCARCHNENPHDARFCIGCGAALSAVCLTCGHANPPYARFCGQCAATLPALSPAPAQSDGELKQITLLFADVSGSTELIESLDPEEAAKRLAPAIDAMQEAVRRFDGSVVRVQGDGIMALFGTPKPQETMRCGQFCRWRSVGDQGLTRHAAFGTSLSIVLAKS